jgi:hypothetical protein
MLTRIINKQWYGMTGAEANPQETKAWQDLCSELVPGKATGFSA